MVCCHDALVLQAHQQQHLVFHFFSACCLMRDDLHCYISTVPAAPVHAAKAASTKQCTCHTAANTSGLIQKPAAKKKDIACRATC
jgi:hypothetical protein